MNKSRNTAILVVALLMMVTAYLVEKGQSVFFVKLVLPLETIGRRVGDWKAIGSDKTLDPKSLDILKPDDYLLRNYKNGYGNICSLFIAYFGMQQEGKMIHSPQHCLPGGGAKIVSKDTENININGLQYKVNELVIGSGSQLFRVLYWYQGRSRVESNEYWARLALVIDGVLINRNDEALVRLTMPIGYKDNFLKSQLEFAGIIMEELEKNMKPIVK